MGWCWPAAGMSVPVSDELRRPPTVRMAFLTLSRYATVGGWAVRAPEAMLMNSLAKACLRFL